MRLGWISESMAVLQRTSRKNLGFQAGSFMANRASQELLGARHLGHFTCVETKEWRWDQWPYGEMPAGRSQASLMWPLNRHVSTIQETRSSGHPNARGSTGWPESWTAATTLAKIVNVQRVATQSEESKIEQLESSAQVALKWLILSLRFCIWGHSGTGLDLPFTWDPRRGMWREAVNPLLAWNYDAKQVNCSVNTTSYPTKSCCMRAWIKILNPPARHEVPWFSSKLEAQLDLWSQVPFHGRRSHVQLLGLHRFVVWIKKQMSTNDLWNKLEFR